MSATSTTSDSGSRRNAVLGYLIARGLWSLAAIWIIVSATFILVYSIPDYSHFVVVRGMAMAGASPEEIRQALEELSPEYNLFEDYIAWMQTVFSFDFGPVGGEVIDATVITLLYLIPAALLAFFGAMVLGYISAVRRNSITDFLLRSSSYLVYAVPNFLGAAILVNYLGGGPGSTDPHWLIATPPVPGNLEIGDLAYLILPALFMTFHLMAVQLRYARAESLEYLQSTFVKTVRAKGAHPIRVARHVLRTAAVPLFTLFVVEVIGILLVTIFVIESVFNVPGIGLYAYDAVINERITETLVVTMLFSVIILAADFLQDISYALLDPRIAAD